MSLLRDIRGWSRREWLMLLVALVLTGFVAYLILANYITARRLRSALYDQADHETAQHAHALAAFLGEQQETIAEQAASPEVATYHENLALGMSLEYGLRQSLLTIGERLDGLRARKLVGGQAIFSRIRLEDPAGRILAQSPADDGGAAPAGPPPAAEAGPTIALTGDRSSLLLSCPVRHRNATAGRILAWIEIASLYRAIDSYAAGEITTLLAPASEPGQLLGDLRPTDLPPGAIPAGPGGPRQSETYDAEHHHLAITVPIAGIPLAVIGLRSYERSLGSEPWHALAITAVLSVILLGGSLLLVRHMVRSRLLGAMVSELQVREREVSAVNRESLNREVSARLRAEEERTRLGYVVEQAAESIIITDAAGVIEYVNPAFTSITGWSRPEAEGRTPSIVKSGIHDQAFYRAMWQQLLAGQPWSGRLINRRRDGALIHTESTISPVRDAQGAVVRFVGVSRDVTRLVQMEEHLQQAQKLESIGQLAAGIAHEINTPVQFIGDNLRFLADGFADLRRVVERPAAGDGAQTDLAYLLAEIPKALAQSQEGVARVAQIVRAMKEFSHPDSQAVVLADINRAIESTATVARNEWRYVAELELALAPDLPPVPLLVGDFNQVVLNLIVNAAHAIADKRERLAAQTLGRITVGTRRDSDQVVVEVADDGCGIPATLQPRVFEPFFTTKGIGRGTGQGLALARTVIVKKLAGSISFASTEGIGTTFTIRLPLATPRKGDEEPIARTPGGA